MALEIIKKLPPYGMPPADGVGSKPEYVEPNWEEIFKNGPGGGNGGDWPPRVDFIGDNEAVVVIRDGMVDNRADSRVNLSGSLSAENAKGLEFSTDAPKLNGFIIAGDTTYSFENSTLRAAGNGKNDFAGNGAVIMAIDNAALTLKNVDIETTGVIRPCTFAANDSVLKVYDSVLNGNGGVLPDDYKPVIGMGMMVPPPGLEIDGNCRTHLSVGNAHSYFYNSKIIADGWAALSTDAGDEYLYLEANDCDIVCKNSGYGVYSDGSCHVVLNRCKVDTATHTAIMAGECSLAINDCAINSGGFSVMVHSVMGVTCETARLKITGGEINTGSDTILVKSQNIYIEIDGTKISAKNGTILHSIINPDECATAVKPGEELYGVKCAISNTELSGDIVHDDDARTMAVSLYGTKLTGAVKNAYLSLDEKSAWTAAADSVVGLVGAVTADMLDAPAGVTITATACEGCTLSGNLTLQSGGKLVVL